MEIRSLLLAAQILVSYGLIAQSWCPSGATWVYRYTYFGSVDYREEHTFVGDTLIDGVLANKVQVINYGEINGMLINNSYHQYTTLQNDVVLAYLGASDTMTWDTLYWFGAVPGDRWWPIGSTMELAPFGMLEVVDTGSVMIDGIDLKTLTMSYLDADGNSSIGGFTITERVGSVPRVPHMMDDAVIDWFFPVLICYADTEIATGPQPCELTVSLPELSDHDPIKVQPNPGSHFFQLTGLGDRPVQMRMTDLQGRVVLESRQLTDQLPMDVSELRSGIYLIEINNGFAGRQVLRWVKE